MVLLVCVYRCESGDRVVETCLTTLWRDTQKSSWVIVISQTLCPWLRIWSMILKIRWWLHIVDAATLSIFYNTSFGTERGMLSLSEKLRWHEITFGEYNKCSKTLPVGDVSGVPKIGDRGEAAVDGCHGPLARYVKLRVVHALGMLGTLSPPSTSK